MTPFNPHLVHLAHDERRQRLRRTRTWSEDRPSSRADLRRRRNR